MRASACASLAKPLKAGRGRNVASSALAAVPAAHQQLLRLLLLLLPPVVTPSQ
jgi:hypothetical protein